ncbi:MAG: phage portal protein [Anaerovoracaceae bacterium]
MLFRRKVKEKEEARSGYPISLDMFGFQGHSYPLLQLQQTIYGDRETIGASYASYATAAYGDNPIVFGIERLRMAVFSDARFMWRQLRSGKPGDLFSTATLEILRHPYPGGTTGDLLARAILDADLAGNHYAVRLGDRIKRLRPDWVTIVVGSDSDTDLDPNQDPSAEVIGYVYQPGGTGSAAKPITYLADDVAHFAPIPDPLANYRGMSWLTPVIRDVEADKATTTHKNKFFQNGATPNMIVKFDASISPDNAARFRELFTAEHEGAANAYKTMYLGGGADAKTVGADFRQIDFAATTGKGENRIAVASGIHATLLGLSEGLQGSSLNAGNYGAARRSVADTVFRPLWRDLCGSYETIVPPPAGAELWVDLDGVAFLREDQKDAAEIMGAKSATIANLVREGFTPESVVAAVVEENPSLLVHTGKVSVQLTDPNEVSDE